MKQERSRTPWYYRYGYLSCTVRYMDGTQTTIQQHREIMEDVLGRELLTEEHVHHKDGNRTNNCPSNLEILTKSEHARQHAFELRGRRPWKHGTKSGYGYHKCRCDKCRAAHAATQRKWAAKRRSSPTGRRH